MMTADDDSQPFASLQALQQTSDQLIENLPDPDDPSSSGPDSADCPERIAQFIARAVDTGSVLDAPSDRKAAQSLIDFWAAKSYALQGSSSRPRRRAARAATSLREFDSATLKEAGARGDAALATLDDQDKDIARRILLRLVRLNEVDGIALSSPARRGELALLASPQRVEKVLAVLLDAGILTALPGEPELVSLRYDALIRQWETLRSWIDKRAGFREQAAFWERSSRPSNALASGRGANQALKDYADLNMLERTFIAESTSRSRTRNVVRTVLACAGVVIVAVLLGGSYVIVRKNQQLQQEIETRKRTLLSAANADLEKDLRWLAEKNLSIQIQNRDVTNLNLSGIYDGRERPAIVDFIKSNLRSVRFERAALPYASFSQANLVDTSFQSATLTSARFDEAVVTSTSFANARLYRSLFDRARFVDVDFSNTDLRSTSFRQVKLHDDRVPNFNGTAWWLALGWSLKQIDRFAVLFPREKLKGQQTYESDVAENTRRLSETTEPIDRAVALNDLAWTHAIYGIDLEAAQKDVQEAAEIFVRLRGEKGDQAWGGDTYDNLQDTSAYIFLQQGNVAAAKEALERVPRKLENDGETMFKYAIALHATSEREPEPERSILAGRAITYLEVALGRHNYVPSHELYILRPYLKGNFEQALKRALQMPAD